jgi:hypothetical protein
MHLNLFKNVWIYFSLNLSILMSNTYLNVCNSKGLRFGCGMQNDVKPHRSY